MHRTSPIPGFHGLRAFACVAVFMVHLQQLTLTHDRPKIAGRTGPIDWGRLAENGNTGVCVFFMLSGFLLSLPFWFTTNAADSLRETPTPRWLIGYTLRRLARIVPAYYLCLTALVLMGRSTSTTDTLLHYAFIHNFTEKTIYSISDPFWTIAVQMQLYLIFALVMLPLAPLLKNRSVVGIVLIVGIIAAYLAHSSLFTSSITGMGRAAQASSVVRASTLAHLPHFLLGMLAALIFASKKDESQTHPGETPIENGSTVHDVIVLLCAAGIIAILAVPSLDEWFRLPSGASEMRMVGRYNFPYVPLLLAVILITLPRTRMLANLLDIAPLRYVGVISYGIYLFHLPCMELCKRLLTAGKPNAPINTFTLALLGLSSAIIVASISYWIIERPLLRWSKRARPVAQI